MCFSQSSVAGLSLASLLLVLGSSLSAQSLDLPARRPSAQEGTAFARSIAELPLNEREQRIIAEVRAGNVPPFFASWYACRSFREPSRRITSSLLTISQSVRTTITFLHH